ncbi:hypothetical protein ACH79_05185 [Bradyrhizobium sp. CCBAU 051011]|jgi:hypothetical protein|uniref:hypothetical protein n=1 Tax=Bradyrhizobium sp. CCBAU 051011 TaxID=858422 RepID=UPI00137409E7|nr:hypothetical protein [Bradyrhizobium sp. CCBAU 051011]QHO72098.1 hypothetical protein ACH79_05185 [Bradyrhizobium sp. CCBAU 051011]
MTASPKNITWTALLGSAFYLISIGPSFAYLDPGSGSMLLTAILGVLAATTYTLKGYFHKATTLFRRNRPEAGDAAGRTKD